MNNKDTIHMSINEFKENGYKVIDWIADYYENTFKRGGAGAINTRVDESYVKKLLGYFKHKGR